METLQTIYECFTGKQNTMPVTYKTKHYANTEQAAIKYLENNGGGKLHNALHNLSFTVNRKP